MDYARLQAAIGYRFGQESLLQQALTHRSFGTPHNERLEFLGDSILNCTIAIELFERYERLREGEMSRLRATLVRQEALHQIAVVLNLGSFLRLGEGELKSGGFRRPSILADALEALFAAVFLDGGLEAARGVISKLYRPMIDALDNRAVLKDPKTALQEWLQGRRKPLPRYELAEIRGEAHAQEFEVTCVIDQPSVRTIGVGPSRRAAEQQAAQGALQRLQGK
ncbi:ribonuclease III [Cognatazoarcus halotolerans]|uniref:ribonuclease III n=1 Tax=Cognatazoarcus halotolerans TaxID=2686016 RepID=UPI00135B83E6|nr:ribonuclease III [Cognatazoarcus halotolerans]MBX3679137.1 ribonuclease III [Rhodocyclaceae bacterium]MCB1898069.1 ribonuclease III [Rhodocyclaceae bacterium]MCP5309239.1 ribonuclease III [Zoogloeaceae bacterium]